MVTLFGGIFGGLSIVWDRRFGFLHKMLAAPIARGSIVVGKSLAAAVQGAAQGLLIFAVALAMGVEFKAGLLGVLFLVALAMLITMVFAGISLALGAVITSHEALMAVVNFLTMPLMFSSSAMMPLEFMPRWLGVVARFNPLTYAVTPLRALFLVGLDWPALGQGFLVLTLGAATLTFVAARIFDRQVA